MRPVTPCADSVLEPLASLQGLSTPYPFLNPRNVTGNDSVPPSGGAGLSSLGRIGKIVAPRRAWKWAAKEFTAKLMPSSRMAYCLQNPRFGVEDGPAVHCSAQGRAFYKGLSTCSSQACVICAERIASQRLAELQECRKAADVLKLRQFFITVTIPHTASDRLYLSFDRLMDLEKKVKADKAYRKLKEEVGYVGAVTATEVTFGRLNGFHPHRHQDLFCSNPTVTASHIEEVLRGIYARKLVGMGYAAGTVAAALVHQIKVTDASERIDQYMQKYGVMPKWDELKEMTLSQFKRGRGHGLTPWELLNMAMDGDVNAGDLFREYAVTIQGRRMLVFSPGLREALGLKDAEVPDEEAASFEQEEGPLVYQFCLADWQDVVWAGLRGEVLQAAEQFGSAGVERIVSEARRLRSEALSELLKKRGESYVRRSYRGSLFGE